MTKLYYTKLPEDTNMDCCYAFYSGYCTGAAYSCPERAEYVLTDEDGQHYTLTYCEKHMHSEWISKFIEGGREVVEHE